MAEEVEYTVIHGLAMRCDDQRPLRRSGAVKAVQGRSRKTRAALQSKVHERGRSTTTHELTTPAETTPDADHNHHNRNRTRPPTPSSAPPSLMCTEVVHRRVGVCAFTPHFLMLHRMQCPRVLSIDSGADVVLSFQNDVIVSAPPRSQSG